MKRNIIALAGFFYMAVIFSSCNKNSGNLPSVITSGQKINSAVLSISSVYPASSIPFGAVTISGSNFDTAKTNNIVKFNGVNALVNSATPTKLVVTVPFSATSGNISLTVNGTTVTSQSIFKVLHWTLLVSKPAYLTDPGTGTRRSLTKIATAKDGTLYGLVTLGTNSHVIVKFNRGSFSIFYKPAANHDITSLAVDSANNVVTLLDTVQSNSTAGPLYLVKINPVAGTATKCSDFIGAPIEDLATDGAGNIYVSLLFESVLKIGPTGATDVLIIGDAPGPVTVDNNNNVFVQVNLGRLCELAPGQNGDNATFLRDGEREDGTMACDKANNLFIVNFSTMQIRNTAGYFGFYPLPNWHSLQDSPISMSFDNFGHVYCLTPKGIAEFAIK